MTISTNYAAGRLTISLCGELDQHEAPRASRAITELLDEYLPRDCVLDLSGLNFMDSSGIAVIVRSSERMRALRGRIFLDNPGGQVLRVLDAAGIDRLVPIKGGKVGEPT